MKSMTKEEVWILKEKHNGIFSDAYSIDITRLKVGEPLDYIIGFSMFLRCKIDLSYKPLIPRAETEYWTEKAILEIQRKFGDQKVNILDIFSGSGCIGVAVLSNTIKTYVDFADINENALSQIQKNININNINPERCKIYNSDVYKNIPVDKKYNVIFANPPYISQNNIQRIDISVLRYEPHDALFATQNGLDLIIKTIKKAQEFLTSDGILFLECDDIQYQDVCTLLENYDFKYEFFKDQFGLWRYVRAFKNLKI